MFAAVVAIAGCGGGGGGGKTTTAAQPAPSTTITTNSASGSTSLPPSTTTTESKSTSNEEQSGDETPISTQALFTGRGGKITPQTIEVPPFIAVTVVLRSADGKTYSIEANGHGMATNGRAQLKLPGLRAEKRYVIKNNSGTPAKLIIEANAEPGP